MIHQIEATVITSDHFIAIRVAFARQAIPLIYPAEDQRARLAILIIYAAFFRKTAGPDRDRAPIGINDQAPGCVGAKVAQISDAIGVRVRDVKLLKEGNGLGGLFLDKHETPRCGAGRYWSCSLNSPAVRVKMNSRMSPSRVWAPNMYQTYAGFPMLLKRPYKGV